MSLSLGVILVCLLAALAALLGCGVGLWRHWSRPSLSDLFLPAGAILTLAFIPAVIGHAEGVFTPAGPALWMLGLVGGLGILFHILGWRAALRQRALPSACPHCGYDCRGLPRSQTLCPECGRGRDSAAARER